MPEYYNSSNGSGRYPRDERYGRTGGSQQSNSRKSSFDEGYTSANTRSWQPSQQSSTGASADSTHSSSGGRFIDAGDRYIRTPYTTDSDQPQTSLPRVTSDSAGYAPAARQYNGADLSHSGDYYGRYSRESSDRRATDNSYSHQPGQSAAENSRYPSENRYSYGFDDDFEPRQQQRQYSGRADNGNYTASERFSASDQYAHSTAQRDQRYERQPVQGSQYPNGAGYHTAASPTAQRYGGQGGQFEQYYDDGELAEDNRASAADIPRTARSDGYYRAAPSQPVRTNDRADFIGSVIDWFNRLSSRQLTWMLVGVGVVLVAVVLAVCLVAHGDSCTGCGSGVDIPVVVQGDGDEQDYSFGSSSELETVSTSDGLVTIDEDIETDSFTVGVTGADGTYRRTDVSTANAAVLVISSQDDIGFDFSLEVSGDSGKGSLSAHAYFCGTHEAIYEGAQGLINFSFGSNGVSIYQVDIIDALEGFSPDGTYVAGSPEYVEDAAAKADELGLDADIRTSEAIQAALDELLSEDDSVLLELIFTYGTQRVYEGSEKGYDRNGTAINIDSELESVKYYAFIDGTGEELVLICTADGKVYLGICDGAEYRYYTNDPNYSETAPKSISGQAKGKAMELVFQQ